MKPLLLITIVIVGLISAIPASASAETFEGRCTIEGTATIYEAKSFEKEQALPKELPAPRNYKFVSSKGECEGAEFNKAEVKGEGELACGISEGGAVLLGSGKGSGSIEINKIPRTIEKFGFKGGVVLAFEAEGEHVKGLHGIGPATGTATFAKNPTAVVECAKEELKKLFFTAVATGQFS
jgi:hypothetical protein